MKKVFFVFNIVFSVACLFFASITYAQSIPVGMSVLDDYYRRVQLLGKGDSSLSFSVRPLLTKEVLNAKDIFDPDSSLKNDHWVSSSQFSFAGGRGQLQILPLSWQQQFNSNHPYGWNDGAMIPARGYQTMVSGGFYIKYGPLSVQIRPEYVYAANTDFTGYATNRSDAELYSYYAFHNLVDWPERYGNNAYSKAFLGQSSIRLTFGALSIGLSNENLWWGPGIQNALVLTNNAAGFKHITINTSKPIKTILGDFEGQILAGHLDNSGYPPLSVTTLPDGTNLYETKRNEWRYFTGFNINYHPKWITGLTLGIIRTFDAYYDDIKKGGFNAYVPFFTSYEKKNVNNGIGDLFPRDQITSLYGRWLFTKAQAEVYFEYGLEDNLYNLSDFVQSPDHARAYIFGLRKFISVGGDNYQKILFNTEITQTSQHADNTIRPGALWYLNYQLLQGHTNDGQTLGAGTGTGGNIQSVDISWVSGLKKLGVEFERYEHDMDFAETYLPPINGYSRNWVDFALALKGEWNYKNLLFNAKLQEIKSLNYEWILKNYNPDQYYIPHNDVYNFHGELGITYRF